MNENQCIKGKEMFMQIHNTSSNQNFGMALRINKNAAAKLKELPMEVLTDIQKVGHDLKGTRFYHVEIDENLGCKLTSEKDAYFGLDIPHARTKQGKERNIVIIDDLFGIARYETDSKPNYNIWSYTPLTNINSIKSFKTIAKLLDGAAIKHYEENAAKVVENADVARSVDNLINSFGIDA